MPAKVHLNPDQASLLFAKPKFGERPPAVPAAATRVKKRKQDLPENQVEGQVTQFLRSRGWFVERQHVGTFVAYRVLVALRKAECDADREKALRGAIPVRIGEKGKPDWVATRRCSGSGGGLMPHLAFEFEIKAPGKRLSPEQAEYIRKAIALKRNAYWWDSFESFRSQYRELTGE